jgi:hypothetical protein
MIQHFLKRKLILTKNNLDTRIQRYHLIMKRLNNIQETDCLTKKTFGKNKGYTLNGIVNLASPLTPTVTSPTYDTQACVVLPQGPPGPSGAQGPSGIQGPAGTGQGNLFKIFKVDNQSDLIPTGIETLKFIGQTGISILTDTSQNPYKSITINAAPLSGYFEAENIIGYKANLTPAGYDNYYIQFPQVLYSTPKSLVCTFQNVVDDIAYYFNIGNINSTGFYINFSDVLLNSGYYLNIQVKK